jgi:hypothetical protein
LSASVGENWHSQNQPDFGDDILRIVAADSGAAILNDKFEPITVVAAVSILAEPPYKTASSFLAEPIFADANNGYQLIVHELELCQQLLKTVKADVVHLDLSMRGMNLEELSAVGISTMKKSRKVRGQILKIMPKLRKTASSILRTYGIEVFAFGKESIPVRIAELTSGAHAIRYAAEKAIKENVKLRLGLPTKCQPEFFKDKIGLLSLMPTESEVVGYAECGRDLLEGIQITEMLNPCARGFKMLEITPLPVN